MLSLLHLSLEFYAIIVLLRLCVLNNAHKTCNKVDQLTNDTDLLCLTLWILRVCCTLSLSWQGVH